MIFKQLLSFLKMEAPPGELTRSQISYRRREATKSTWTTLSLQKSLPLD